MVVPYLMADLEELSQISTGIVQNALRTDIIQLTLGSVRFFDYYLNESLLR